MELKTKVHAQKGEQQILITRDFDLPVNLIFKAYTEAELLQEWMGTKVLKLESTDHGSYRFETTDPKGNKHYFSGVIHQCQPGSIIRTFEMEGTPYPVQLEYLTFRATGPETSQLTIKTVYQSVEARDEILKLPFVQGINWAHSRLEACFKK